jgi:hypothetical protein
MIAVPDLPRVLNTIALKQGARPIVQAAGNGSAPADATEAAFQAAAAANAAALRVSPPACVTFKWHALLIKHAQIGASPQH